MTARDSVDAVVESLADMLISIVEGKVAGCESDGLLVPPLDEALLMRHGEQLAQAFGEVLATARACAVCRVVPQGTAGVAH